MSDPHKNDGLVDIGVNLTSKQFKPDLNAVIQRALEAKVNRLIVTGLTAPLSQEALRLAKKWPGKLWCTAGVHPHNAKTFDAQTPGELRTLAEQPEVVAIGECGLDFDRDFSPRDQQRAAFEKQLEIAAELKKPVFLHERSAHEEFFQVLSNWRSRLVGGVVHCFTGTERELERYLELDLCIGMTGFVCDERRGTHLKALLPRIPLDRLMIETDAPFLLPRTLGQNGGRRNEPANLPHIAEFIAEELGQPKDVVWRATTETAVKLFGLSG